MSIHIDIQNKLAKLVADFEVNKVNLLAKEQVGLPNLVFGDVLLLGKIEPLPNSESWLARQVVRTGIPQVFIWIFKNSVPIFSSFAN